MTPASCEKLPRRSQLCGNSTFVFLGVCGKVQRRVRHVLQDQRQRGLGPSPLQISQGKTGRVPGQRHQVEFHQVCCGQGGSAEGQVWSHR